MRCASILLPLLASGCARFEYDLISPPDLARHIGETDTSASIPPVRYTFRTVENHLVIFIYNRASEPLTLLGAQSYLVDPQRESHPLPTRTIAPDSFIKLILPPPEPQASGSSSVGVGVGVGVGGFYGGPGYVYDIPRSGPPPGEPPYWSWTGETNARLRLTYQLHQQEPFSHEFVFHRRQM